MNPKAYYFYLITTVGMMAQWRLVLPLHCHFACAQVHSRYDAVLVIEERLSLEEVALTRDVDWLHLVSSKQGMNNVHKDWFYLAVNMEAWKGMTLAVNMEAWKGMIFALEMS